MVTGEVLLSAYKLKATGAYYKDMQERQLLNIDLKDGENLVIEENRFGSLLHKATALMKLSDWNWLVNHGR